MNISHFIDGKVMPGAPGERVADVFNPATGQVSGQVSLAGAAMVDQAVAAAAAAFPAWSGTAPLRRAHILFRFRELLMQRRGELAAAITREHGKVLADAEGEVTPRHRDRGVCLRRAATVVGRRTRTMWVAASTTGTCASHWAWPWASRHSIFR